MDIERKLFCKLPSGQLLGVGPNTRNSDEITILFTEINVEQNVLRNFGHGQFTVPIIRWSRVYNLTFEDQDDSEKPAPNVRGADGSRSSGVGWMSRWDLLDSNMTPTENH